MLPFQVDFFRNDLNPGLKMVVEGHESMKHNFEHWPAEHLAIFLWHKNARFFGVVFWWGVITWKPSALFLRQ